MTGKAVWFLPPNAIAGSGVRQWLLDVARGIGGEVGDRLPWSCPRPLHLFGAFRAAWLPGALRRRLGGRLTFWTPSPGSGGLERCPALFARSLDRVVVVGDREERMAGREALRRGMRVRYLGDGAREVAATGAARLCAAYADGLVPDSPIADRPQIPDGGELQSTYGQGRETGWLEFLGKDGWPRHRPHRFRVQETLGLCDLPPNRPVHVADVGCGVGIFAVGLAKRFPLATVEGWDISGVQVEAARRWAQSQGVASRVRFGCGGAGSVALSAEPDVVVMTEVLEHLLDPVTPLRAIVSGCPDRTRFVLSVPQRFPYRGVIYDQDGVEFDDPWLLDLRKPWIRYWHERYDEGSFLSLLDQVGLEAIDLRGVAVTSSWLGDAVWRLVRWRWMDGALNAASRRAWAGVLLAKARKRSE